MDQSALSTPRIPYDVLISIIDALALEGRVKELSAFSQTCRMLLHPCRAHLFSVITINKNADQFAALLNRNPTLQVYIRELRYKPSVLSEELANAFLLLSNVKNLSLLGYSHGTGVGLPCQWLSLPPHTQHALGHLLSSPSLIHIKLYSFSNVPIFLLSSCPNLMHLDIDHYTSFTSDPCDTLLAPPKLVSLDLTKAVRSTIASLLDMLDFSGLKSLHMTIRGPADERDLEQILRLIPKLEHLYLLEGVFTDGIAQTLTISLPTLRSLEMTWGTHNKFSELIRVLQTLSYHPNRINEIGITFETPWSCGFADQDWENFEQVLTGFRQLKKLSLKFWSLLGESDELGAKAMQDQLSEFRATKLVRLSSASNHLDFQFALDDDEPRWMYIFDP